jgi:predicted dehydrogenase
MSRTTIDPASRFHATLEAVREDSLPMKVIRLITLAPGHFHAALVQKKSIDGVARRGHIYGPLDRDTIAHVERIAAFNSRPDDPTRWEIDLRAGPDWRDRFLREQPGNTVVLSGRNRPKIDLMALAVENGLHILADKPWIVEYQDFAKLEAVLREADLREVLTGDMMTERHEITNILQRELIGKPDLFGRWTAGTPEHPALALESVHYLKKWVSGRPLARPWWWFDPAISGEAMADVGTHLADLALWLLVPDHAVDYRTDLALLDADRWPLVLSEEQFRFITMLAGFPEELTARVVEGQLYYAGNNSATFALRGVHVKLTTTWEFEAPPGGTDLHNAVAHGTRANIAIRQPQGKRPELFVSAVSPAERAEVLRILQVKCDELATRFPGLSVDDRGQELRLVIPDDLRTGHESHFAAVMDEYVRFFNTPRAVPSWERPNALAKYFITTKAVELARQKRPGV